MTERIPDVLESSELFHGRVFDLRSDLLRHPNGKQRIDVVEHPGSFAIAALPDPGRIVLVRQYRHPARRYLWEIPAGTAHAQEDPQAGARRELREETGYTADTCELICSLYPTPGYSSERVCLFAARGLHPGPQALDEDEAIDVRICSVDEARSMQASGEIVDMKTALALLWLAGERDK